MFEHIRIISELLKLRDMSEQLNKIKEESSNAEFDAMLVDFEQSVDRLNKTLESQFSGDPDVMQVAYELKSTIVALRRVNVESDS